MKFFTLLCVFLVGCDNSVMTTSEIRSLKKSCKLADTQLAKLKYTQHYKGFGFDPDALNDVDREYNALIKESIWWYAYTCNKS